MPAGTHQLSKGVRAYAATQSAYERAVLPPPTQPTTPPTCRLRNSAHCAAAAAEPKVNANIICSEWRQAGRPDGKARKPARRSHAVAFAIAGEVVNGRDHRHMRTLPPEPVIEARFIEMHVDVGVFCEDGDPVVRGPEVRMSPLAIDLSPSDSE